MRKICHAITLTINVPIGRLFNDGTEGTTADLEQRSDASFFVDVNGNKRIQARTVDELSEKLTKQIEGMFW